MPENDSPQSGGVFFRASLPVIEAERVGDGGRIPGMA
jgi:hypothetical protein